MFDTETTGVDPENDKIIEFVAHKFDKDGNFKEKISFLCDPGMPIPKKVQEITSITDEMVKGKKPFIERSTEVREFLEGVPAVAHNAAFDVAFIQNGLDKPIKDFR